MDETNFLYGKNNADLADQVKEVKVKLPVEQLVKLHGLKILQGKTISESISGALERYLRDQGVLFGEAPAKEDN